MNGAVIGDPHGDLSPRGDGDGKKLSPRVLTGTGTGNFSPRGDGDGGSIPDGDFPVAIPIAVSGPMRGRRGPVRSIAAADIEVLVPTAS
jgi:hypothetical protein